MPHVIEIGELIEVSFVCNISDQYTYNVLHYEAAAVSGVIVTDSMIAADMSALFAPLYKEILADVSVFYGVTTQVIRPTRYDKVYNIAGRGIGVLTGDQLPPQVCGVVSFKSGFAHRSKMGRMYLPASSEEDNEVTGRPTNGYLDGAQAIASSYLAGLTVTSGGGSVSLQPVIFSRKLSSIFNVTATIVHDSWGTLRSRSDLGHLDAPPF